MDIVAGGSKRFLGRITQADELDVSAHRGVVSYEPTELVITSRAGTPLAELELTLAEHRQMLAFEPPHLGPTATLGGTVASASSGPRRPYAGAIRDFVLGVDVLNGNGEYLSFGGRVMKNVAGYDLSRLMAGAMGTLGILLQVSLKVLPMAGRDTTLAFEMDAASGIESINAWAGTPLPLSGAYHDGQRLYVRLSGTHGGVASAVQRLGGEVDEDSERWLRLREQQLDFFSTELPLWRLSVPPATPPLGLDGETLWDWGGAIRWLASDADSAAIRAAVEEVGGHGTLYRNGDRHGAVYHPLSASMLKLHQRLKQAFDPKRIFNRGRMYEEL